MQNIQAYHSMAFLVIANPDIIINLFGIPGTQYLIIDNQSKICDIIERKEVKSILDSFADLAAKVVIKQSATQHIFSNSGFKI